jgi:type VI secretion system protein ImpG
MFRDLYVAELDYLYALADEVGREHARIAPTLGRGADPSVTRLVQSVAFLAARLRQRLDDDLPEVIHPVVESIAPWLLATIPSATIVELVPEASLKEPAIVRAGSPFGSRPIDGVACVFRSAEDAVVRPWVLESVEARAERTELRFVLRAGDDAALGALTGPLRIFLAAPLGDALDLRSRLLYGTERVVARVGDREVPLAGVKAAPPPPLSSADPHDARYAMRAYFAWAEPFAFVDIGPLDPIGPVGADARAIEIVVHLRAALPTSVVIEPARFRLHAVAAVNVGRPQMISAPFDRRRTFLRMPRDGAQLGGISKVTLVRENLAVVPAEPLARLLPPILDDGGRAPVLYRVDRSYAPTGLELDVALSFSSGVPLDDVTTVDVEATVTDGERAAGVGVGEVCVPVPGSPSIVKFRNVTAVTRPAPPPVESGALWEWFHLFKVTLPQLLDRGTLGRALAVTNVAAAMRWPGAKASADEFEPLLDVRWRRASKAEQAEVFPGAEIDVDLDVARFAGRGDVDLFAERLADLFASTLRDHEWVRLTVRDGARRVLRAIGPLFGTREGL